ncbi:MAG: hypothetical protein AABZ60_23560 [Planctomycetota bacterium]
MKIVQIKAGLPLSCLGKKLSELEGKKYFKKDIDLLVEGEQNGEVFRFRVVGFYNPRSKRTKISFLSHQFASGSVEASQTVPVAMANRTFFQEPQAIVRNGEVQNNEIKYLSEFGLGFRDCASTGYLSVSSFKKA